MSREARNRADVNMFDHEDKKKLVRDFGGCWLEFFCSEPLQVFLAPFFSSSTM